MHTDRKTIVDALCKHKLTFNQYFFLQIAFYRDYALFYQLGDAKVKFDKDEIEPLVKRNLIINERSDGEFYIENFEANQENCKPIFEKPPEARDLGQEFWEAFPSNMYIQGKKVSTKSCDKEDLIKHYNDKVSKKKHAIILEAVKIDSTDGIGMGIEKWYKSEQWVEIMKDDSNLKKRNDHVF